MQENIAEGFEKFWIAYPIKVGKKIARRKFEIARRSATQEQIMTGLAKYLIRKPDWQQYAHPSTWLSQERWNDEGALSEAAKPQPKYSGGYRPFVPSTPIIKPQEPIRRTTPEERAQALEAFAAIRKAIR